MSELDPRAVVARLAALATLYVPETIEAGRARLARERPIIVEPFETAVERRLDELRALDELTRHLHRECSTKLRERPWIRNRADHADRRRSASARCAALPIASRPRAGISR